MQKWKLYLVVAVVFLALFTCIGGCFGSIVWVVWRFIASLPLWLKIVLGAAYLVGQGILLQQRYVQRSFQEIQMFTSNGEIICLHKGLHDRLSCKLFYERTQPVMVHFIFRTFLKGEIARVPVVGSKNVHALIDRVIPENST